MSKVGMTRLEVFFAVPCIALAVFLSLQACALPDQQRRLEEKGKLALVIRDASTKKLVPARVELLDETGKGHVAHNALPILTSGPLAGGNVKSEFTVTQRFPNPQTRTDQFYSTGRSRFRLPPGRYRLTIRKGLEYRTVRATLQITAGESTRHKFELTRWINMPQRGWYGADGHLHLPRPTPESNDGIHQWMAAEDIHVANLLQMGSSKTFGFAPQYAHGEKGHYGKGHHLLVSGQENPRTHFLGHIVILGTDSPIHYPEEYLDFTKFFKEAHRQGALNGFAHFGRHSGGQSGLSLVLPHNVLDFLEILQFEKRYYDIWYKILNTGFRLTPTAGSDYPWGYSYPGRERFYTRVLGGLTVAKWIESVRAGHTFVTNGPMLDFKVNGEEMGGDLQISKPGKVDVEAAVYFDRERDRIGELELVENGVLVRSLRPSAHRFQHEVLQSGWLALRARGLKRGELPVRESLAHSAPIYISVGNTPPLDRTEEARRMARSWIFLLNDLEERLSDERFERLGKRSGTAPVDLETVRRNRPALLKAIKEARDHFREQSR